MASVFWDAHGILVINYHKKGKTINSGIIKSTEYTNKKTA